MAKMGRRKTMIKRRKVSAKVLSVNESVARVGCIPATLVVGAIQVQTVATQGFVHSAFGVPIMREGFITGTGLLVGS